MFANRAREDKFINRVRIMLSIGRHIIACNIIIESDQLLDSDVVAAACDCSLPRCGLSGPNAGYQQGIHAAMHITVGEIFLFLVIILFGYAATDSSFMMCRV